jgi:catechol 2,3-dioxygenase-like lactoylglutathione lyase family enzyme
MRPERGAPPGIEPWGADDERRPVDPARPEDLDPPSSSTVPTPTRPSGSRIERLVLITSDALRLAEEYGRVFGARVIQQGPADPLVLAAIDASGAQALACELLIGGQRVDLVELASCPGASYPVGSTASDLWFQHFAVRVGDIDSAHEAVRRAGTFLPISRGGPIRLPESSGGVSAVKFRDFDGHPLELLQLHSEQEAASPATAFGVGGHPEIHHTALAVASTETSVAFYHRFLGFVPTSSTQNTGREQTALDDIEAASVTVTQLRGDPLGPALELLEYSVGSRRPSPTGTRARDIASTHCVISVPVLDPILESLRSWTGPKVSVRLVGSGEGGRLVALADPDGHRLLLRERL